MIKKAVFKLFIIVGAISSCPPSYAKCDFSINKANYFFDNGSPVSTKIKILKTCSNNSIYKRDIHKVEIDLYRGGEKFLSLDFDNGVWMPAQKKFFFKLKSPLTSGCFKGANNLTLNLKSGSLNSTNGHLFSLRTGATLKITCPELKGFNLDI